MQIELIMTEVLVEPDDVAHQLREYVRSNPDVQKDEYADPRADPIEGACYVLAEAYFHAQGGTDSNLEVYRLDWSDVHEDFEGAHWFLRDTGADADDVVIDLSLPEPADGELVPWDLATHRAFITGYTPSNRTQTVLDALGLDA